MAGGPAARGGWGYRVRGGNTGTCLPPDRADLSTSSEMISFILNTASDGTDQADGLSEAESPS